MTLKTLHKTTDYQWIDIQGLKKENIAEVSKNYDISPLWLEDCIDANHLPKFEEAGNLKFFLTRQNNPNEKPHPNLISDVSTKLGIFVRDNLLVTVHRIENQCIMNLIEKLNAGQIPETNPYKLTLHLANNTFFSFDKENQKMLDMLDRMESDIFLKNEQPEKQIRRIFLFKRKAGLILKVLNLSAEWVNSFDKLPLSSMEIKDLKDNHKDCISDFDHLAIQSANLLSLLLALSDQQANQVMKALAVISVFFLPITFIAGVYGMNFDVMPELHYRYGYYAALGLMLCIVVLTYIAVKRQKWV